MKYTKKRVVKFLFAAFALISAFGAAMTVNAAAPKLSAKKVTCCENGYAFLTLKGVKTDDVTTDIKNPKIASVTYEPGEKKNSYGRIKVTGYKKGKTTATLIVRYGKKQKKTLKFSIQVKKAAFPCASFKLGNKDYANKLSRENMYVWDKTLKGRLRISVRAKSGWRVARIYLLTEEYASKNIKNNATVDTSKYKSACIEFQNMKTKSMIDATVTWGNWDETM